MVTPAIVMKISSVLRLITPPTSFVVVAGDWPGSLISLLVLNLPIQGAFSRSGFMNILNLLNIKLPPGNQSQTSTALRTTQPKFFVVRRGLLPQTCVGLVRGLPARHHHI